MEQQGNQDPRAQRSRIRMIEAVRQIIMTEGAEAVTHQRVADVAGVGRATVYRHWQSSDDMIYALLDDDPFRLLGEDIEGSLRERLSTWLLWVSRLIGDPKRRTVILHILSRTEADARANSLRMNRVRELTVQLDAVLVETAAWRQLPPPRKMDGVSLLIGPVMMRTLFMNQVVSQETVNEVVETFLGWLSRQPGNE